MPRLIFTPPIFVVPGDALARTRVRDSEERPSIFPGALRNKVRFSRSAPGQICENPGKSSEKKF
jgi:hypothetical protein